MEYPFEIRAWSMSTWNGEWGRTNSMMRPHGGFFLFLLVRWVSKVGICFESRVMIDSDGTY